MAGVVEGEGGDVVEGVVRFLSEMDGFFLGKAEAADDAGVRRRIGEFPVVKVEGIDEVVDGGLIGDGLEDAAIRGGDGDGLGFMKIVGRNVAVVARAATADNEQEEGAEDEDFFHEDHFPC